MILILLNKYIGLIKSKIFDKYNLILNIIFMYEESFINI